MPTVFRWHGIRFFFFSNEGDPREPMHIHAEGDGGEAKFAESVGFRHRTLSAMLAIVEGRKDEIERAWHEHFG